MPRPSWLLALAPVVSVIAFLSNPHGAHAATDAVTCVPNVMTAFASVKAKVDKKMLLAATDNGKVPLPRYTNLPSNAYGGIFGGQNHFQGLVRYKQYAIVSGGDPHMGDPKSKSSRLFFIHMGTRNAQGPWATTRGNLVDRTIHGKKRKNVPPAQDGVYESMQLSRDLWHAGGMQVMGDYLAVPIEKSGEPGTSEIVIVDLSNPRAPTKFNSGIRRARKAGAVAMTKLKNGHILLGVWADSDKDMAQNLDFYYSRSTNIRDGFEAEPVRWDAKNVKASKKNKQKPTFNKFQTINFIPQCDGKLYLMGMHNTAPGGASPVVPGKDYADLYQVFFPTNEELEKLGVAKTLKSNPVGVRYLKQPQYRRMPTITKVANKHMTCKDGHCNFGAGGAPYVTNNGRLLIYGVSHWRVANTGSLDEQTIKFQEFGY